MHHHGVACGSPRVLSHVRPTLHVSAPGRLTTVSTDRVSCRCLSLAVLWIRITRVPASDRRSARQREQCRAPLVGATATLFFVLGLARRSRSPNNTHQTRVKARGVRPRAGAPAHDDEMTHGMAAGGGSGDGEAEASRSRPARPLATVTWRATYLRQSIWLETD